MTAAKKLLDSLPVSIRGFYQAQYGTGIGNINGELLGLSCKCCKTWGDAGHDAGCPVSALPGSAKAIRVLKAWEGARCPSST